MKRELLAFGLASDGQLGLRVSDTDNIRVPEHIIGGPSSEEGSSVVSIACGEKHTLMLASDGKVWSVGSNEDGQLGRGNRGAGSFTIYPVSIAGVKIVQIAAGRAHSLAVVEDGRLFAWGCNIRGQLAMPNEVLLKTSPTRITRINNVVQVASGPEHCVALLDSGRVLVWGEQPDGAVLHVPLELTCLYGLPITRVAAGGRHCVALSSGGSVYVWGHNEYGQLGVGDTMPKNKPVRLETMTNMKTIEVACGYSHTLLLTSEGRLFAFGSDALGQLGRGRKNEQQTVPVAIDDLMGSNVTRVSCGRCHSIVVIGGRLYPFGLNSSGQLGNGLIRNQITPRVTDQLDHVSAVFAGWDQTFIMRSGGVPDISPGPSNPLREPTFLYRSAVSELLAKSDKLGLMELLESVFSSLSSINGSFVYSDQQKFISVESKNSGVDLDQVMECFNQLAATNDAKLYAELIIDSCQMSAFSDELDPSKFTSAECLRMFLILPWLDAFVVRVNEEIVNNLHMPFAVRILSLPDFLQKRIDVWWRNVPRRHFNRLVSAMIHGVQALVLKKKDPIQCLPMLQVLTTLNTINKDTNLVPLESFYIHELNDNYNLKQDYAHWKMNHTDAARRNFWANYPFLMNGIAKADMLHVDAAIQQQIIVSRSVVQYGPFQIQLEQPFYTIAVNRNQLVQSTINQLVSSATTDLVKPLKVTFNGEEAEDAGGVKKEFFFLLFQQILHSEYGMFVEDSDSHYVWFSGFDVMEEEYFRIVGILCGLAIYNHVLVPFPFPLALYKMLLGQSPTLEDLAELSPVEAKSLQSLLEYEGDDFEEVFSLSFTCSSQQFGSTITTDLKPHGADLSVTQGNKAEYVQLYLKYRFETGPAGNIAKQFASFANGFKTLINGDLMSLFQPRELMEMIIGNENYDWTEFRKVVKYKGEYNESHPTIIAFWNAFFKLSLEERKMFMQFLMGSTRLPVRGLSDIEIYVQPCAEHLLPVAHTCANLLELPNIADEKELLRRLQISIKHTEGFTLV